MWKDATAHIINNLKHLPNTKTNEKRNAHTTHDDDVVQTQSKKIQIIVMLIWYVAH